jgi:uncharacterized protein (DUF433 family)
VPPKRRQQPERYAKFGPKICLGIKGIKNHTTQNINWPIDKVKILKYTKVMENEELLNYIVIDQGIRFGKPCIKGTRITVGDILQWLSEGIPVSEILEDYPLLEEVHIKAALVFAARREEITKVIAAV